MHNIFLGGLQGLAEFLPISSSGHLALAHRLLGLDADVLARTVLFHVGTLAAVITFFFRDIGRYLRQRRLLGYMLVVTFLTSAVGLFLHESVKRLFSSPVWIGGFLFVNGVVLLATRRAEGPGRRGITLLDSVVMGCAQGLAVLPGISRSGMTIAVLLLRGCEPREAFRFSFIVSLPAVAAAFIFETATADTAALLTDPSIYAGMATAYLLGLMTLYVLEGLLLMRRFYLFGFYCLALGALAALVIR